MITDKSVASSARSEEYFNEIKNLIFKGMKNIRVDKFLISHMRSFEGTIKIFNADNTTSNEIDLNKIKISHTQNEEQLMKTSPQSAVLNEIETWRSQQDKESKRGKYLRICPDVDSIHNRPYITSKIPLLQNSNILRP